MFGEGPYWTIRLFSGVDSQGFTALATQPNYLMAAIRKNITLSAEALKQADALKNAAYASTRSGVITRAVNEAWGRRFGAIAEVSQFSQSRPAPSRKQKPIRLRRGKQN